MKTSNWRSHPGEDGRDAGCCLVFAWAHGPDLTMLKSDKPWTLGGLAYDLFGVSLTGFLSGALFAGCYNLVGKCPTCRWQE